MKKKPAADRTNVSVTGDDVRLLSVVEDCGYKLNVVIQLLDSQVDLPPVHVTPEDDDGGWGIAMAQDLLRQIRDELRAAAGIDVDDPAVDVVTVGADPKGGAR